MDVYWLNQNTEMPLLRGRSLRRKINSIMISLFKKMKSERVYAHPRHLIIDLVNYCGLRCPICPQGMGLIQRKPARISREFFHQMIEHLGPYLYTMTLTNWGEPMLHPEIVSLVEDARRFPIYIGFSSNMQHWPDLVVDPLLKSGIDEIACSIDGATADVYNTYRVGGDFELAVSNMRKLVDRKRELALPLPKIRWQVLLNRYTEQETGRIIHLAEEWGLDSVVFVPIYTDISGMFIRSASERLDRDKRWLPEDGNLSWYDYQTGHFKNPPVECNKPWEVLVIHPDGAVSPCCAVINPEDDFGALQTGSDFWKIWNNELFRSARRILSGKTGPDTVPTVCRHCHHKGFVIF